MEKIKIFLACSKELQQEREKFRTDVFTKPNIWGDDPHLQPLLWEDMSDAVSSTRSQEEYNKQVRKSDIFILLACRKLGKYSKEEFEVAYKTFQDTDKPSIHIYFKRTDTIEKSLTEFKNRLAEMEHFSNDFNDYNDLWRKFNHQMDLYIKKHHSNKKSQHPDKNSSHSYGPKTLNKHLGSIPPKPSHFIGRQGMLADIYQQLCNNSHVLLLINGQGGMGKTTIAAQYYHQYQDTYQRLIWIVATDSIADALIALPLDIDFAHNSSQSQRLQAVTSTMSGLKTPILLVIDNANNRNDLIHNSRVLRQMSHVHILLTSRASGISELRDYPIDHLAAEDAKELFCYYYKNYQTNEQKLLDKLLKAIGYNTLVIELLSKNLNLLNNELESHYPLQRLLEDLQSKGLLAISESTPIHSDYTLQAAKAEDIILTLYDLSTLNDEEKAILSVFSLLPAISIAYSDLKKYFPQQHKLDQALLTLRDSSWLNYDSDYQSFITNPVIAEIIRQQNRARLQQDCQNMLMSLTQQLKPDGYSGHIDDNFNNILKNILHAETVLNYFTTATETSAQLSINVGNFYSTYGDLLKALPFIKDGAVKFAELYKNNPNNVAFKYDLAVSYLKLGETHRNLGNLEDALQFFNDEIVLFEELYKDNPINIDFKYGFAVSYSNLGQTHSALGNLKEALQFFEKRLILGEELYKDNPNNVNFKYGLVASYSKLGEIHKYLNNLEKALQFFKDSVNLCEELYKESPNNVDFKNGLAVSYSILGETHSVLDNLEEALQFFNNGINLSKELYKDNPNNVNFKYSLAASYSKLGATHRTIGNLKETLQFFNDSKNLSKELYKDNPNNVAFKNGLAVSYIQLALLYGEKLNNPQIAKDFLQRAEKTWAQLCTDFPNYIDFQNNHDWATEQLKNYSD
jgi:tetratricopeptide (TPR) repeat protein